MENGSLIKLTIEIPVNPEVVAELNNIWKLGREGMMINFLPSYLRNATMVSNGTYNLRKYDDGKGMIKRPLSKVPTTRKDLSPIYEDKVVIISDFRGDSERSLRQKFITEIVTTGMYEGEREELEVITKSILDVGYIEAFKKVGTLFIVQRDKSVDAIFERFYIMNDLHLLTNMSFDEKVTQFLTRYNFLIFDASSELSGHSNRIKVANLGASRANLRHLYNTNEDYRNQKDLGGN